MSEAKSTLRTFGSTAVFVTYTDDEPSPAECRVLAAELDMVAAVILALDLNERETVVFHGEP